jgi:transcriptional regulator with XRE-family HTH domain
MTSEELKTTRKSWGYSQPEFAALLQTPLRTYQDWESGRGRIPGIMRVTLGLLLERDERITAKILGAIQTRITKDYPNGIPSEPEPEEEL